MKTLFRSLVTIFLIILMVATIECILMIFNVPEYIIPLPSSIGNVFLERFGYLASETSITMLEAFIGFIIGNMVACGLAVFFTLFPTTEKFGIPIAVFIKSTPIVVLSPIFVIWFGNGMTGKFLMAALICFFPTLINATAGMRSVDNSILEYLKSLGASRWQIIRYVKIPSSIPYIFAAVKATSTISIVGAIVAELSGSDRGIGYILLVSIYQLNTSLMFAAIFCIATSGVMFYYLVCSFEFFFQKYSSNNHFSKID